MSQHEYKFLVAQSQQHHRRVLGKYEKNDHSLRRGRKSSSSSFILALLPSYSLSYSSSSEPSFFFRTGEPTLQLYKEYSFLKPMTTLYIAPGSVRSSWSISSIKRFFLFRFRLLSWSKRMVFCTTGRPTLRSSEPPSNPLFWKNCGTLFSYTLIILNNI